MTQDIEPLCIRAVCAGDDSAGYVLVTLGNLNECTCGGTGAEELVSYLVVAEHESDPGENRHIVCHCHLFLFKVCYLINYAYPTLFVSLCQVRSWDTVRYPYKKYIDIAYFIGYVGYLKDWSNL